MTRLSRPLVCTAVGGTLAAAASAAAFVIGAPRVGGSRSLNLHRGATGGSPTSFEQFTADDVPPQAESDESWSSAFKWVGAGMAAGVMMATMSQPASALSLPGFPSAEDKKYFGPVTANRPIEYDKYGFPIARGGVGKSGPKGDMPREMMGYEKMELCKNNKKFAKRMKDEIYKFQQRQKKFTKGGAVWNGLQADIQQAKRRQEAYGERLCGFADGLPRVMTPGFGQRGGVWAPFFMFIYSAGWIGWTGREYLLRTKSVEKEIQLDLPLVAACSFSGFAWPVAAWKEITEGDFIAPDSEIPVSGQRSYFGL